MRYYITPDDWDIANANGLLPQTVYSRVMRGWSIDDAVSLPVRAKKNVPDYLIKRSKEIGLSKAAIKSRIDRGWNLEEAHTTPKLTNDEIQARARRGIEEKGNVMFGEKEKEIMKQNGITYKLAYTRVYVRKWTKKEAITIPPMDFAVAGAMGYAKAKAMYGNVNGDLFVRR